MVDQIAVVTFDIPFSNGVINVTSPDITEAFSAAILIFSHTSSTASITNDGVIGMGFVTEEEGTVDSIRQGHNTPTLRDAIGTANQAFTTWLSTSALRIVCLHGTSLAVYSSSIAGGVQLTVTPAEALKVTAILFAGLARASIGVVAATTVGVHEDVGLDDVSHDLFEPDVLFGLTGDGALGGSTDDGTSEFGIAINDDVLTQISSFCNFDRTADPGDADGQITTNAFATGHQITTRSIRTTAITSFDSTGFNATSTQGTQNTLFLALKWSNPSRVRVAAANMAVAASTGLQAFNAFGFTPDVVFGRGTLISSLDTFTDGSTAATQGLFVTGRHGSWAISGCHQEGDSRPSTADSIQEASALVMLAPVTNSAVTWRATWGGATGSGGFYLDFSTAGATGYLTAVGIQIIPTEPIQRRRPKLAPKRSRMRYRRFPSISGPAVGQFLAPLLRGIQRFRKAMAIRLRPRLRLPDAPIDDTPSAVDKEAEGSVFAPGARRGEVASGGAEAGIVL